MEPLCERQSQGISVKLWWFRDREPQFRVQVVDEETNEVHNYRVATGKEAMDIFHHPFAYDPMEVLLNDAHN